MWKHLLYFHLMIVIKLSYLTGNCILCRFFFLESDSNPSFPIYQFSKMDLRKGTGGDGGSKKNIIDPYQHCGTV